MAPLRVGDIIRVRTPARYLTIREQLEASLALEAVKQLERATALALRFRRCGPRPVYVTRLRISVREFDGYAPERTSARPVSLNHEWSAIVPEPFQAPRCA